MGTICILHIRFLYLCVSAYVYIPIPLLFAFSSPHITNAVHSCQSAVSYFKSSLIHTSHSRNQIFTKILSLFITVLKGVCSYYPILPYISILPPPRFSSTLKRIHLSCQVAVRTIQKTSHHLRRT